MQFRLLTPLVFLLVAGCVTISTPTARMQQVNFTTAPSGTIAAQIGTILNAERSENGVGPLSYSPALNAAAQAHANDMDAQGYFGHEGADGSSPKQRIERRGYRSCVSAENIAQGQRSASEVMAGWMASRPHRVNNLRGNVKEYGVGFSSDQRTWVLLLASPGC